MNFPNPSAQNPKRKKKFKNFLKQVFLSENKRKGIHQLTRHIRFRFFPKTYTQIASHFRYTEMLSEIIKFFLAIAEKLFGKFNKYTMNKQLSKEEIKRRTKTIETIYQEYIVKLNALKKKQAEIINQFIKELEQKKIEEIRRQLGLA